MSTKRAKPGKRSVEAKLREARSELAETRQRLDATVVSRDQFWLERAAATNQLAYERTAHETTKADLAEARTAVTAAAATVAKADKVVADLQSEVRDLDRALNGSMCREARLESALTEARAALVKAVTAGTFGADTVASPIPPRRPAS
jgi:chromosome segregation ATPase